MKYRDFETLDEVKEFNTPEACYVVYDGMVFDITGNLNTMNNVEDSDCGQDLTMQFSQEDGDDFYEQNIDNYIGNVISEMPVVEEGEGFDMEFFEEEATVVEDVGAEETSLEPTTIMMFSAIVIAIIVVGVVLISSLKNKSEKDS